jgi:glutamine amidotransferase
MIAIIDYGMGNIGNVKRALEKLGYEACLTDSPALIEQAKAVLLPGVGSFKAAMEEIEKRQLTGLLKEQAKKKPLIGICLGMQLLFEMGEEGGTTKGLGLIPGVVKKMNVSLPLPHMGWNRLNVRQGSVKETYVYFVHSYRVETLDKWIVATADYEEVIPAIVQKDRVIGMQFHPEKSGDDGLRLIQQALQGGFLA